MNRRSFLKTAGTSAVVFPMAPSLLSMEGCTISASTLKSYLNTVLESAEKILGLSSSTDSWYTTLANAITALESTESDWDGSTTVTAIVSALDTLEAVLAVIPITAAYSPLIDLLVTVVEYILTTYVAKTKSTLKLKAIAMANPHRGRVPLNNPHFLQSRVGAYKAQWNDIVKANSNLAKAKL